MKKASIIGLVLAVSAILASAQTWTDISTALVQSKAMTFPGGIANCSGLCVNRLTGDVVVKFIDNGMWRSSNKGSSWTRIDNNTVSGRCETGVATTCDQSNPVRIAVFSLDGTPGYTADGTTWHQMTGMGRNWDFGSVDWSSPKASTMIAIHHEDGGKIYKTIDGAVTWQLITSIAVSAQTANDRSMIGVIDSLTFIACNGNGIQRSTNGGATWTQVSTTNAHAKLPANFNGTTYLGTTTGLIVSKDKGATWTKQGASVEITEGPFFGADENTMVVAGPAGYYKTTNAGTAWTKIASLPPAYNGNTFDPLWFGGFCWDPINNVAYATRMVCPAMKLELGPVSVQAQKLAVGSAKGITISGSIIRSAVPFDKVEVYSLSGTLLSRSRITPTCSLHMPHIADIAGSTSIIRVSTVAGTIGDFVR
jgi:hypothetical protein